MTDKEKELAYHIWVLANQLDAVIPFIDDGETVIRQLAYSLAKSEMEYAKEHLKGTDYELKTESRN